MSSVKKPQNLKRTVSFSLIFIFIALVCVWKFGVRVREGVNPGNNPQEFEYARKIEQQYQKRKKEECIGLDGRSCDVKLSTHSKE